MTFKVRTITAIDNDSKHDTQSATLNWDIVLERAMQMNHNGQFDRVVIISDGSSKECKLPTILPKRRS